LLKVALKHQKSKSMTSWVFQTNPIPILKSLVYIQPGFETTIYCPQNEHANHYTIDMVYIHFIINWWLLNEGCPRVSVQKYNR
jgi:hypothetical protein